MNTTGFSDRDPREPRYPHPCNIVLPRRLVIARETDNPLLGERPLEESPPKIVCPVSSAVMAEADGRDMVGAGTTSILRHGL